MKDLIKENKQLIGISRKKDERILELEEAAIEQEQAMMRLRGELKETSLAARKFESDSRKPISMNIEQMELSASASFMPKSKLKLEE